MSYYSGEQRRKAPRIAIRLPVTLTDPQGKTYLGQTSDISNRGLGILLNKPLTERAEFHGSLTLPAEGIHEAVLLEFHIFIIFCTPDTTSKKKWRAGGYFSRMNEHSRKQLDTFLQDKEPLSPAI